MGVALGTPPSIFTSPLTVAVPVVLLAELAGLPALTMRPPEMQMITVKATTRMKHFVFIQPYLLPLSHVICCFHLKFAETLFAPDKVSLRKGARGGCHIAINDPSFSCHFFVRRE